MVSIKKKKILRFKNYIQNPHRAKANKVCKVPNNQRPKLANNGPQIQRTPLQCVNWSIKLAKYEIKQLALTHHFQYGQVISQSGSQRLLSPVWILGATGVLLQGSEGVPSSPWQITKYMYEGETLSETYLSLFLGPERFPLAEQPPRKGCFMGFAFLFFCDILTIIF